MDNGPGAENSGDFETRREAPADLASDLHAEDAPEGDIDASLELIRHEVAEIEEIPRSAWGPEDHARLLEIARELDELLKRVRDQ